MPPEAVDATNSALDGLIRERNAGTAPEKPRQPDADRFKSRASRPEVLPASGRSLRREAQSLRRQLDQEGHRFDSEDVAAKEAKIDDLLAQADEASEARGASIA